MMANSYMDECGELTKGPMPIMPMKVLAKLAQVYQTTLVSPPSFPVNEGK